MKTSKVVILVLLSLTINLFGKYMADSLLLPFWLDSFGTAFTAYLLGPIAGGAVGLTTNLVYGVINTSYISMIYGIINLCIGVAVGICARKKMMETVFGTMNVSVIVTGVSVILSTPLNMMAADGMTGNYFGDGVIEYLLSFNLPKVLCSAVGEFYIDFADKVLTLGALLLSVQFVRFLRKQAKIKNNMFVIGLFIALLAFCPDAYAKKDKELDFYSYTQDVFSSDNGLPCGEANDIAQTKDGILWIGTYAGLYRYNGSDFKWMSEFDSVKNVNCLYVDEEGRLWIGTNDNGLTMSIGDDVTNVVDISEGLPSNSVRSIVRGSDGLYYVGTSESLQVLQLRGGLKVLHTIPEILYAHSLAADESGHVAAVTAKGELFIMNGGGVVGTPIVNDGEEIFTCAVFDKSGKLYVGTSSSNVYTFELNDQKPVKLGKLECLGLKQINSLYFDESGNLFTCTDSGVGYFTPSGKYSILNTQAFNNSVDNMTVDYQGNYWFTSSRLGLLRVTKSAFTEVYGIAGLDKKVVNSIALWKNRLYIGTDTGLDVVYANTYNKTYDSFAASLGDVRVRSAYVDSKDNMWVSTYGLGLAMVPSNGEAVFFNQATGFTDRVRLVAEAKDGTIIASGDNGVGIIKNGVLQKVIEYGSDFSSAMILSIICNDDGSVMLGSDGDGIVVMKDGSVQRTLRIADGLSSDVILRIVRSSDSSGWFIVTSNGLCFMDNDLKIRILNNFPYFNNYDVIMGSSGKAFVLGSAGIYVAEEQDIIADKEGYFTEFLDSKRGLNMALTANSWNYKDDMDNLFLSCDQGVYCVNMRDYGSVQKSFRMKLSTVKLDGVSVEVERGVPITVENDISRIEFQPEILNYTVEDPNVRYILEGFDSDYKVLPASSLSEVVYTNLPSGKYIFHMEVLDSSMQVIEESNYSITKKSKVYDLIWFRIYMLAIAGLAIAWFTWFIARTQIQRTLNFQRKELELARKQVEMGNETILAIAKTVDAKDENTSQHSQRVSEYSVLLAKELGFTPEECENIRKAALLHDIGKISIPDRILNKPAKLDDFEYSVMKTHVERGANILKDFTLIDHVVDGALYHHERYDGKGYMHGLKGEDIPLYGRIIGVADAFDAMTQNRVYRKSLSMDMVCEELKNCSGTQFDPEIAAIMLRLVEEGKVNPGYGETGILKSKDDTSEGSDVKGSLKGEDGETDEKK